MKSATLRIECPFEDMQDAVALTLQELEGGLRLGDICIVKYFEGSRRLPPDTFYGGVGPGTREKNFWHVLVHYQLKGAV